MVDNSPEAIDSSGAASDLARIAVATWRHRVPLAVAALVCAIVAGAAASLRSERWTGSVTLAVGYVPGVERLADPAELAQRLRSPTQVLKMNAMAHCIAADDSKEQPPDCPHHLVLESEVIENTSLVAFTVETDSLVQSRRFVDRVTEMTLIDHNSLFAEATESTQRETEEFEQLLVRLEADLANRSVPQRGASPSLILNVDAVAIWPQVVAVHRHLAVLRSYDLAARARPTRVVAGPEVEWKPRVPNPLLAVLLGAFAGAAISGLVLAMRQTIRDRA